MLQVVELRRLALDEQWLRATKEKDRPECGDAFDVTLSDGVHKLKCALSTSLNSKAYRGSLRLAVLVRVADWRRVEDERIDGTGRSPPIVVVTQLDQLVPSNIGVLNNRDDDDDLVCHPDALAGGAAAQARQVGSLPLLGARKHYLRVDADEVLLTERWTQGAADDAADDGSGLPAAAECPVLSNANHDARPRAADSAAVRVMGDQAQQRRRAGAPTSKGANPPLVGRVLRVGPLLTHGGLHETTPLGFPTRFTFWLWDGTSAAGLPVTVWNRKCEELYAKVCEATLVLVTGYRMAKWKVGFTDGACEWRAMINPSKPEGQVGDGATTQSWSTNSVGPARTPTLSSPCPPPTPHRPSDCVPRGRYVL